MFQRRTYHIAALASLLHALLPCLSQSLTVKDSLVFNRTAHLVTWVDQAGKERKASLVRTGDHTGICQYFSYYDGADKVTVTPGTPDADPLNSGFGSSTHHDATHYAAGTLTQRWLGAGMVVFDWVHAIDGATETISYTFRDGHDYFQWAVTMDSRAGTKGGDSRGPYCTIRWDGQGGPAEGVEYGAKRYFKQPTLSGNGWPNRSGPWTFGGTCDIPYAWEWAHGREIGYVATQTFAQQNAGVPAWSGQLPESGTVLDPNGDQVWKADYQMNFYDQAMKITWGQPYGWTNNSGDAVVPGCLKNGWGQYSLSIVLGSKSAGGVMRIRDENRAIHDGAVTFTATLGTVNTQGPVGTVNPALQPLSPPGYDHNHRAWWITAAGGKIEAVLDIAGAPGSLVSPVLRISGMGIPTAVALNGTALVAGADYQASVHQAAGEVWIALARTLQGKNHITVDGAPQAIRARQPSRAYLSSLLPSGPGLFRLDGSRARKGRLPAQAYLRRGDPALRLLLPDASWQAAGGG